MPARGRELKPDMPTGPKAGASGAAGMGGLGTYFVDHWMWFVLAAIVILLGLFAFYWREPFAKPDPHSLPST